MMFPTFDMQGQKRSAVYHAVRLATLHDRVVKRMDKVCCLADEVEKAAAVLVEATHQSAAFDLPFRPVRKF
ncbi:MAG: hypothetical protein E5W93_15610 [Mesorhizobium sp.]|nr:MAG: hypothetical protein E5W93_15610 [Mesorhizobium sp.]